ncbi:MAG: hypothetical protein AAFZ80_08695, partial [Cyanobacteria bacterium P01_A01_bin.105]
FLYYSKIEYRHKVPVWSMSPSEIPSEWPEVLFKPLGASMLIETFAVPLLTLVLGVVSLAFDTNDNRRHRVLLLGLIILAFLGICGFEINANLQDARGKREDAARIDRLEKNNNVLTDSLEIINETTSQTREEVAALVIQLQRQGVSDEVVEAVKQSLAADQALQTDFEDSRDEIWLDPTAQPITVQYFAKDVDADTVTVKLEELGFKAVAVDGDASDAAMNVLSFGTQVSVEAVQIVALTLTRAGVQIRAIRPLSAEVDSPKRISAAVDAQLGDSCGVWSAEAIRAATDFLGNESGCAPMSAEVAQGL